MERRRIRNRRNEGAEKEKRSGKGLSGKEEDEKEDKE